MKQVYMKLHLTFGVGTIHAYLHVQSSTQPIKHGFVYVYIVEVKL